MSRNLSLAVAMIRAFFVHVALWLAILFGLFWIVNHFFGAA